MLRKLRQTYLQGLPSLQILPGDNTVYKHVHNQCTSMYTIQQDMIHKHCVKTWTSR